MVSGPKFNKIRNQSDINLALFFQVLSIGRIHRKKNPNYDPVSWGNLEDHPTKRKRWSAKSRRYRWGDPVMWKIPAVASAYFWRSKHVKPWFFFTTSKHMKPDQTILNQIKNQIKPWFFTTSKHNFTRSNQIHAFSVLGVPHSSDWTQWTPHLLGGACGSAELPRLEIDLGNFTVQR